MQELLDRRFRTSKCMNIALIDSPMMVLIKGDGTVLETVPIAQWYSMLLL